MGAYVSIEIDYPDGAALESVGIDSVLLDQCNTLVEYVQEFHVPQFEWRFV